MTRLLGVLREEFGTMPLALRLAGWLTAGWPLGTGGRLRAQAYRLAGIKIGPGTMIAGPIEFGMAGGSCRNLQIGGSCFLNSPLFIDAAASVTLGNGVSVGHHVVIVTTSHALGPTLFRAGAVEAAPISIGDGAWIAASVTLLPGVTIGHGAVVAAGAVVTKDVAPNTLVGGVPARLIKMLPAETEALRTQDEL